MTGRFVPCCVVVLLCMPPVLSKGSAGPSRARDDGKSSTDLGIVYDAEVAKGPFKLGRPVPLTLRFENPTDREVTIWLGGFWPNHRILVTDKSGAQPPPTPVGKRRNAAFAPGGGRDKNAPKILKPGAKYRDARGLDLSELYRLDKGRYQVQVIYHDAQDPTPLRLVTEAVEFEIR